MLDSASAKLSPLSSLSTFYYTVYTQTMHIHIHTHSYIINIHIATVPLMKHENITLEYDGVDMFVYGYV